MKKRIIRIFALLLLVTPTFAQFRTGVKGGGNISNINMSMNGVELEIYKPRVGVHAGFMAEYMFNKYFGLHSELMYCYSGVTINSDKYTRGLDIPPEISLTGYVDRHTFQLPLSLKTKLALSSGTKLYLMCGGFISYASVANQHVRTSDGQESMKVKWSLFKPEIRILDKTDPNVYMQERWNIGLGAEIGAEVIDKVTVGIGFKHGLNDLAAFNYTIDGHPITPSMQMWTASISAGYFF